ncbi:hypothetical protein Ddc_06573 [Ditylenchus destructor]|nr:hypothetical protein Ddc_06573 [Ditylenchus destructor]
MVPAFAHYCPSGEGSTPPPDLFRVVTTAAQHQDPSPCFWRSNFYKILEEFLAKRIKFIVYLWIFGNQFTIPFPPDTAGPFYFTPRADTAKLIFIPSSSSSQAAAHLGAAIAHKSSPLNISGSSRVEMRPMNSPYNNAAVENQPISMRGVAPFQGLLIFKVMLLFRRFVFDYLSVEILRGCQASIKDCCQ